MSEFCGTAKNLFLAWFLNVIPGAGLIYVQKTGIGILFIVLGLIGYFLTFTGIGAIIGVPFLIVWIGLACVLSVVFGKKHNRRFVV